MGKDTKAWVAQARAAGMNDEQIRTALQQQGWQKRDIQRLLTAQAKKRHDLWWLAKRLLIVLAFLVVAPMVISFVRLNGIFIKNAPDSAVAAWLSSYATSITTYANERLTASTKDGNVVFGRTFAHRRYAVDLRAFPDGGSGYPLIDKFDLFLVRHDGTIAWERNFIARIAPKFSYQTKYAVANQQEVQIANAKSIPMHAYIDDDRWDVRWCSATTIQVGLVDGLHGGGSNPNLLTPWAHVNLEDGSFTTVNDPQQVCTAAQPPDELADEPYRCESTVDFLHKAGPLLDEYDETGAGRRQKHEVQKVFWQFPCWGHYENGILETAGLSVQPTAGDSTTLVF